MRLLRRLARWLNPAPEAEQITRLNTKAQFLPDELLEKRIRDARALIVGESKLVEEHPDTWPTRRPINYDEWL